MNNRKIHLTIILILFLSSCCHTVDTRTAKGSSYSPDEHELNFIKYGNLPFYSTTDSQYIKLKDVVIRDSNQYRTLFNKTIDVDFNTYDLVYIRGLIKEYDAEFQERVLIDHKKKSYIIELRGYYKTCKNKEPVRKYFAYLSELLLIPKIPKGYRVKRLRYVPVDNVNS